MATVRMTFDEFTAQLPALLDNMAPATGSTPRIQSALHALYEAASRLHDEVNRLPRPKTPDAVRKQYPFLGWNIEARQGFGGRPAIRPVEMSSSEVGEFLKAA